VDLGKGMGRPETAARTGALVVLGERPGGRKETRADVRGMGDESRHVWVGRDGAGGRRSPVAALLLYTQDCTKPSYKDCVKGS
jgi:hypothetical protein